MARNAIFLNFPKVLNFREVGSNSNNIKPKQ